MNLLGIFGSSDRKAAPKAPPVEEKQPTLEELLRNLPADAREAAEIGAVRAELSKSPDYAQKAFRYLEGKSGGSEMARLALLTGNPEAAIGFLEEYAADDAAEVAKKHFGFDRAIQVYEKAMKKYDIARYHEGIARLYEEMGDAAKAGEFFRSAIVGYEKARRFGDAERLEREKGMLDNTIEIYVRAAESEELGHNILVYYERGAAIAESTGNVARARELRENAFDTLSNHKLGFIYGDEIRSLAKKIGNKRKLVAAYKLIGQWEKAAELAAEEGLTEMAIEIYGKMDKPDKAGKVALDSGDVIRAMKIYEDAGCYAAAARTAQDHGNPQKALELCESRIKAEGENVTLNINPEYYKIALAAAADMGNEEKRKQIGENAMQTFSILGRFEISATFAGILGDAGRAETYIRLAGLSAKRPRVS